MYSQPGMSGLADYTPTLVFPSTPWTLISGKLTLARLTDVPDGGVVHVVVYPVVVYHGGVPGVMVRCGDGRVLGAPRGMGPGTGIPLCYTVFSTVLPLCYTVFSTVLPLWYLYPLLYTTVAPLPATVHHCGTLQTPLYCHCGTLQTPLYCHCGTSPVPYPPLWYIPGPVPATVVQ